MNRGLRDGWYIAAASGALKAGPRAFEEPKDRPEPDAALT